MQSQSKHILLKLYKLLKLFKLYNFLIPFLKMTVKDTAINFSRMSDANT